MRIIFLAALLLCALLTKPHAVSWNDASRLATIEALVTRHTFAIDGTAFSKITKDKYRYGGHTFSDKPPLPALQGAIVAAIAQPLGAPLAPNGGLAIYLVTLFTVGVWFAIGITYVYLLQQLLGVPAQTAAFAAALAGLGTLVLPYATVLANHVPAGAAILAAIYHLARGRDGARLHLVAAGAFASIAYAFDAAACVIAIAAAMLLPVARWDRWAIFALTCAPLVALQLLFNEYTGGTFGPPAMNAASWSDPASPFHYRFHESLLPFPHLADFARYAVYVTVGGKGLIVYTPLVVLCVAGLALLVREGGMQRRVALAIIAMSTVYVLLTIVFTNDFGAQNYGERRYVDILFALCVGLGPVLRSLRLHWQQWVARAIAIASIVIAALGTLAPFGGRVGQSGFGVAWAALLELMHRAPLQAALDVVALIVVLAVTLLRWPAFAEVSTRGVRTTRAALGDPSA